MNKSSNTQNRRSRRSNLLMAATLEHPGGATPVTLRNLSAEGALVEGEVCLAAGSPIVFRKKELAVSGKVAWTAGRRTGVSFDMALDPDTVLHHVPAPKARSVQPYKRPGFHGQLSPEERRFAEMVWDKPLPSIEK